MIKKVSRNEMRKIRHTRIRENLSGTSERPRLCVFRSNANIEAQIIDDVKGVTLVEGKDLIEMGKVYGLSRYGLFKEVILPGAMPSILVGLRMSLGYMWLFLVVSETIAANFGIGYMTMNAREFLQTDIMVLGILLKERR